MSHTPFFRLPWTEARMPAFAMGKEQVSNDIRRLQEGLKSTDVAEKEKAEKAKPTLDALDAYVTTEVLPRMAREIGADKQGDNSDLQLRVENMLMRYTGDTKYEVGIPTNQEWIDMLLAAGIISGAELLKINSASSAAPRSQNGVTIESNPANPQAPAYRSRFDTVRTPENAPDAIKYAIVYGSSDTSAKPVAVLQYQLNSQGTPVIRGWCSEPGAPKELILSHVSSTEPDYIEAARPRDHRVYIMPNLPNFQAAPTSASSSFRSSSTPTWAMDRGDPERRWRDWKNGVRSNGSYEPSDGRGYAPGTPTSNYQVVENGVYYSSPDAYARGRMSAPDPYAAERRLYRSFDSPMTQGHVDRMGGLAYLRTQNQMRERYADQIQSEIIEDFDAAMKSGDPNFVRFGKAFNNAMKQWPSNPDRRYGDLAIARSQLAAMQQRMMIYHANEEARARYEGWTNMKEYTVNPPAGALSFGPGTNDIAPGNTIYITVPKEAYGGDKDFVVPFRPWTVQSVDAVEHYELLSRLGIVWKKNETPMSTYPDGRKRVSSVTFRFTKPGKFLINGAEVQAGQPIAPVIARTDTPSFTPQVTPKVQPRTVVPDAVTPPKVDTKPKSAPSTPAPQPSITPQAPEKRETPQSPLLPNEEEETASANDAVPPPFDPQVEPRSPSDRPKQSPERNDTPADISRMVELAKTLPKKMQIDSKDPDTLKKTPVIELARNYIAWSTAERELFAQELAKTQLDTKDSIIESVEMLDNGTIIIIWKTYDELEISPNGSIKWRGHEPRRKSPPTVLAGDATDDLETPQV